MPEEIELDPREEQEKLHEIHEQHAEHPSHAWHLEWTHFISLSTAILAVIAAIAALQSGSLVNEALLIKSEAVQLQAEASDSWSYYQATSIKGHTSEQTAAILAASAAGAGAAAKWEQKARDYDKKKEAQKADAEAKEKARDAANDRAEHYMHRHHLFAYCVTLTQVAIALSAIAALTKSRRAWYLSLVVGLGGTVLLVMGFFSH